MSFKYLYKGQSFDSEMAVRKSIWENDRVAFGKPQTAKDWEELGVDLIVVEFGKQEKNKKLSLLNGLFKRYRESNETFLVSSLGFKANANTTAYNNVSGLISQLQYRIDCGEESPTVGFMTFDDEFVELGLNELKTLQCEISMNGSNVYSQKWMYRELILKAETLESLNSIEIEFVHSDFSKKGE